MSQNDFVIANQSAPDFRSDLNNALQALASLSSGATAPATTYANMLWYDSANNTLKMRSEADDAWISIGYLDQSTNAFRILDDTQVVNTSGTQTGLLGDQATAAWETGTSTTESLVSPAKIAAAINTIGSTGNFVGGVTITSSGTYTVPAGYIATVVAIGAGGSGGAAIYSNANGSCAANGGGSGGICVKKVDATSGEISLSVTIGSGGSAVSFSSTTSTNGNAGGATTVTGPGISMSAGGGAGGTASRASGTSAVSASAVSGGTASGGDINKTGAGVGAANKTAGSVGVWGNSGATPIVASPESSGSQTPDSNTLRGSISSFGLTDAVLSSGQTRLRAVFNSPDGRTEATNGGRGCGGGAVAAVNQNDTLFGTTGSGGDGAVYFMLEAKS